MLSILFVLPAILVFPIITATHKLHVEQQRDTVTMETHIYFEMSSKTDTFTCDSFANILINNIQQLYSY